MVTKVKNPSIDLSGDTSGIVMPSGTTAQRPSAAEGLLRYNSTLKRLEQSDGSDFETIALPPTISSLSGNYNEDNDTTITIDETKAPSLSQEIEAKIKGYEGEACGECGNFTLVRNGTCMKCNTCGATSGCS